MEFSVESLDLLNTLLMTIKHLLALMGSLVIFAGALYAIGQFIIRMAQNPVRRQVLNFDRIRLDLGRSIALGLEFIIAADVVQTMTAPDYYSLGMLALLAVIRTFLNYFLNKDMDSLSKREQENLN